MVLVRVKRENKPSVLQGGLTAASWMCNQSQHVHLWNTDTSVAKKSYLVCLRTMKLKRRLGQQSISYASYVSFKLHTDEQPERVHYFVSLHAREMERLHLFWTSGPARSYWRSQCNPVFNVSNIWNMCSIGESGPVLVLFLILAACKESE